MRSLDFRKIYDKSQSNFQTGCEEKMIQASGGNGRLMIELLQTFGNLTPYPNRKLVQFIETTTFFHVEEFIVLSVQSAGRAAERPTCRTSSSLPPPPLPRPPYNGTE